MKRPSSEWERVIMSKTNQALAHKIEAIRQINDERAAIVHGIVDTYAAASKVYELFPTLSDAFTGEGVFKMVYAASITPMKYHWQLHYILTRCAWLVVKGTSLYDVKREYCSIQRRYELNNVTPYVEKPKRLKSQPYTLMLEALQVKERPAYVTLSFICWRRVIA